MPGRTGRTPGPVTWLITAAIAPAPLGPVVLGVSFLLSGWLVSAGVLWGLAGAAASRGRVNAIDRTVTFSAGASGSMRGALTYHHGGWTMTAWVGAATGLMLLLVQATQPRVARGFEGDAT